MLTCNKQSNFLVDRFALMPDGLPPVSEELKFQPWFSTTNQTVFINPHLQVMSLGLLGTQQGKIILE